MTVALFTRTLRWLVKRPAADGLRRETERILRAMPAERTSPKSNRTGDKT